MRALLAFALAVLAAGTIGARADELDGWCAQVTKAPSIIICSDPELRQQVLARNKLFETAQQKLSADAYRALNADQSRWVKLYTARCGIGLDDPVPTLPVPANVIECYRQASRARTAYLAGRLDEPSAALAQSSPAPAVPGQVGPAFNCDKASRPLAVLICSDRDLARVDLAFNQAYWSLFQQLSDVERQKIKEEDVEFLKDVQEECGVPTSGALPSDTGWARDCVKRRYQEKRAAWLSRESGAAYDEATRPLERHIALERNLRELGFLSTPVVPEGVYGPGARQAILTWQRARGRPATGLLGETDAVALEREGVVAGGPQPAPSRPAEGAPVAPVAAPDASTTAIGAWFECLYQAADALGGQPEPARTVVDAAFGSCTQFELIYQKTVPDLEWDFFEKAKTTIMAPKVLARVMALREARDRLRKEAPPHSPTTDYNRM